MNKEKTLKARFLNNLLKHGKKSTSEKITTKSFKLLQKSQKKLHNEIIKLAIQNNTPIFRMIQLKNNKRKKKLLNEIPIFISNYKFRTSWGIKYLLNTQSSKINSIFYVKLKNEIILNAQEKGFAVSYKNEIQNKAFQKKRYFKFYRW